ncbi:MAG: UDP-N-acetylglucosamine 2-epimerase (non-hydrolyzing) [Candidatus Wallbacteria bacterium]|nr:UDP-N-acetylglucosamine 2-epimerase (non-hydrolyzing) [Candidatus Wallbacteria bacterium]
MLKPKKMLFIFGTRPEAIKFAPLIRKCRAVQDFDVRIAVTAQHREMLDQVLSFFQIRPDHDLDLMKPGQDLFALTAGALTGLKKVLIQEKPDLTFVQGDTTTVFSAALASFYLKIPVAHLEAGLRSHQPYSPFPEELNRRLTGHLSTYHFAPTEGARLNLEREGIIDNVHLTGNTVIDALLLALEILEKTQDQAAILKYYESFYPGFGRLAADKSRIVLITGHRRESFGDPFESICRAIRRAAEKYRQALFVYPVHLNPNVQKPVRQILSGLPNLILTPPLEYPKLVWLMKKSYFVLTDSGGIQEEAPALGKPVLVMRDVTERMEGVEAGTACLVGTTEQKIYDGICCLFDDSATYDKMSKAVNPYGDGHASEKIVEILKGIRTDA